MAIFSLEMGKQELMSRLNSLVSGIDSQRIRKHKLSNEDFRKLAMATDEIRTSRLYIDDMVALTPMDMRSRLRRIKAQQGLKLVMVDYLQLMESGSQKRGESRQNVARVVCKVR